MNNNIDRTNRKIAEKCREYIISSHSNEEKENLIYGNGEKGEEIHALLNTRPYKKIRISENALNVCVSTNVNPFDFFIMPYSELYEKHRNFFCLKESNKDNWRVIAVPDIHNNELIRRMILLNEEKPKNTVKDFLALLNQQSIDLITKEERDILDKSKFSEFGTREQRDAFLSQKTEFVDLWLTPKYVIDEFFRLSQLDKSKCMDPCASDGRWLGDEGYSMDIIPMNKMVHKGDFLETRKAELPTSVRAIVGNLPFSLLDEFVEKSMELVDECYFLVSGDTILKHYPNHIKHLYIFSGLEGNQRDNRSRCEFDVPYLMKSALWCCIVHITKEEQEPWIIERDLSKEERRDGYHVALGKNEFIRSEVPVDDNPRISRILVKSDIEFKGGVKIKTKKGLIEPKNRIYS